MKLEKYMAFEELNENEQRINTFFIEDLTSNKVKIHYTWNGNSTRFFMDLNEFKENIESKKYILTGNYGKPDFLSYGREKVKKLYDL